ncbi:universal stress protein [Spelaeicoccus albus]|uniref:Nucleotide-binding universal stress UspA family protein n=1 Tax=Spelaeicoccus albus TaxID=1280376 RepID=A0A7Z0D3E6_9MICO|nr:universal stress protein [Spelaeicoccus albus]NYI68116.1 nucleotide-binding universal stress UspA family protein [Spelaeicoccus albus]
MSDKTIVVGVHPGQPVDVVRTAAAFAHDLGAVLICAFVDVTQFGQDGDLRPIDPDTESDGDARELRERLDAVLADVEANWDFQVLGGNPAEALALLAADLGAYSIVVGTRHRGLRAGALEFFGGSVAVHLAHHQHLPVVVVPLSPTPAGQAAPWES